MAPRHLPFPLLLSLAAAGLVPVRPASAPAPRKPAPPPHNPPSQVCRLLPRPPAEVTLRPTTPLHHLHVRHAQAAEAAAAAGNTRRGRALWRKANKIKQALARAEKGQG